MKQRDDTNARRTPGRVIDRRTLLRGAAGLVGGAFLAACDLEGFGNGATPTPMIESTVTPMVTSVAGYDDPARWADHTLTIATPTGEYQEAQQVAVFEPFERLTGATIQVERADLDDLRNQVETAEVRWSACDVAAEDVLPLANAGVVQELDYTVIDDEHLFDFLVMPHGAASSLYATVMAYREDQWEGSSVPSSWSDFWDLDRFPGNRGLPREPATTLEFALLADGVSMNNLYPLDVDRALASLENIRESIVLWWEQGAQASQMIASADVAMVGAWHNRIQRISTAENPINIRWEGAALNGRCWVVPSGAPNSAIAMDFINFATRPEVCSVFSQLHPFGPANRMAFELFPPELASSLPGNPGLLDDQFPIDFEWWFTNREEAQSRFEEWLAETEP